MMVIRCINGSYSVTDDVGSTGVEIIEEIMMTQEVALNLTLTHLMMSPIFYHQYTCATGLFKQKKNCQHQIMYIIGTSVTDNYDVCTQ